jgi:hypothetical protein
MRRFLFNGGVLGALFGGISAVRQTAKGPRDWRLALIWLGWGISVTLAVLAVRDEAREAREQAELEGYGYND